MLAAVFFPPLPSSRKVRQRTWQRLIEYVWSTNRLPGQREALAIARGEIILAIQRTCVDVASGLDGIPAIVYKKKLYILLL